jgi:hypothetical protein
MRALPKCDFVKNEEIIYNTLQVGFDFFKELKTENFNELIEKTNSEVTKNKIEIAKHEFKECSLNKYLEKHGERAEIYCVRSFLIKMLEIGKEFYGFKSSTPTRSNNYTIQITLDDYVNKTVGNDSNLLLKNFMYYLNDKFDIAKSEGKKLKRFYIIDQSILKALIEYKTEVVKGDDNRYDRDSSIRVLNFPLRDVPPGFIDEHYVKPYKKSELVDDCTVEAKQPKLERELINLDSSSDDSDNPNERDKVNESIPEQVVEPLAVQIDETPNEPTNDKTVNETANPRNNPTVKVSSNTAVTTSSKRAQENSPDPVLKSSFRLIQKNEHADNKTFTRRSMSDNNSSLFSKYSINPDNINNMNRMNTRVIPAPLTPSFNQPLSLSNISSFSSPYRNDGRLQPIHSINYSDLEMRRVKFKNIENNFILANEKMNRIGSSNFIRFMNLQDKSKFDITFLNEMERGLQMINDCCDSVMEALINQCKK